MKSSKIVFSIFKCSLISFIVFMTSANSHSEEKLKHFNETASAVLKSAITIQETYFVENFKYTKSMNNLAKLGLQVPDNVTFVIIKADGNSMEMRSFHKKGDRVYVFENGKIVVRKRESIAKDSQLLLFKDWAFGTSRSHIASLNDVYDCSSELGEEALCKKTFNFLGIEWEIAFMFLKDKLVNITLLTPFSSEKYAAIFSALDSFKVVAFKSSSDILDIVELKRTIKDKNSLIRKLSQFEKQGLDNGNFNYVFLEKEAIKDFEASAENVSELITKSPIHTREVDYQILTSENETFCILKFILPKATTKVLREIKPKKVEKF